MAAQLVCDWNNSLFLHAIDSFSLTGASNLSTSLGNSTFSSPGSNGDESSSFASRSRIQSYRGPSGDLYATPIPKQERDKQLSLSRTDSPTYIPTTLAVTTTNTNGSTSVGSRIVTPTVTSTPHHQEAPKRPRPYGSKSNDPGYASVSELGIGSKHSMPRVGSDGYATVESVMTTSQPVDPGYATVGERVGGVSVGARRSESRLSESLSPEPKEGEGVRYLTLRNIAGLGISVAGGIDRPEGPHIYIEKITEGLAAHQVKIKKSIFFIVS